MFIHRDYSNVLHNKLGDDTEDIVAEIGQWPSDYNWHLFNILNQFPFKNKVMLEYSDTGGGGYETMIFFENQGHVRMLATDGSRLIYQQRACSVLDLHNIKMSLKSYKSFHEMPEVDFIIYEFVDLDSQLSTGILIGDPFAAFENLLP